MKKISIVASSVVGVGVVVLSGLSIVSAATTNGNVGESDIPRTVYRQDRLDATAQVLNTTTSNVQTARKDKTLNKLISSAGLTRKTFGQKVKAQVTTDLEKQGYSQDQVTIAMQHHTIGRLHHKIRNAS